MGGGLGGGRCGTRRACRWGRWRPPSSAPSCPSPPPPDPPRPWPAREGARCRAERPPRRPGAVQRRRGGGSHVSAVGPGPAGRHPASALRAGPASGGLPGPAPPPRSRRRSRHSPPPARSGTRPAPLRGSFPVNPRVVLGASESPSRRRAGSGGRNHGRPPCSPVLRHGGQRRRVRIGSLMGAVD